MGRSAWDVTNRWKAASDLTSVSARSDSDMRFCKRGRARRRAALGIGTADDVEVETRPLLEELELVDAWRSMDADDRRSRLPRLLASASDMGSPSFTLRIASGVAGDRERETRWRTGVLVADRVESMSSCVSLVLLDDA